MLSSLWDGKHSCYKLLCHDRMCWEGTAKKACLPSLGRWGPGASWDYLKWGALRESRNSLPRQTLDTSPSNCFKSCREFKIEAFWREERVLWGRFVCFCFYLPPWNAVKTWRSQHSEKALQRNKTPSCQNEG